MNARSEIKNLNYVFYFNIRINNCPREFKFTGTFLKTIS